MCNKLQEVIDHLKFEIECFDNPSGYQDENYYIECAAKVCILEDVLSFVEQLNTRDAKHV